MSVAELCNRRPPDASFRKLLRIVRPRFGSGKKKRELLRLQNPNDRNDLKHRKDSKDSKDSKDKEVLSLSPAGLPC